jgi:hypothetical protein
MVAEIGKRPIRNAPFFRVGKRFGGGNPHVTLRDVRKTAESKIMWGKIIQTPL